MFEGYYADIYHLSYVRIQQLILVREECVHQHNEMTIIPIIPLSSSSFFLSSFLLNLVVGLQKLAWAPNSQQY